MNMWLDRVEMILAHVAGQVKLANDRRFEMQLHKKRVQENAALVKEALRGQLSKTEVCFTYSPNKNKVFFHNGISSIKLLRIRF